MKIHRRTIVLRFRASIFFFSVLDKLKKLIFFRRDTNRLYQSLGGYILHRALHPESFTKEKINEITGNYSEFIGGSYAKVYRGTLPDHSMVAVTIFMVRRENGDRSSGFLDEARIQSEMNHKNILKLVGCCPNIDA